eukprot:jgi/Ulvmu1/7481/UM037_0025.1
MDKGDFRYTSCYCEENVYYMLQKLDESWEGDLYAVLMSNSNRTVPIWCNSRLGGPVIWDYHVIALGCTPEGETVMFDLDSSLPLPCPAVLWTQRALLVGSDLCNSPQLKRRWRAVHASQFLQHFASDRSHMIKEVIENGRVRHEWSSPPPPYDCISTPQASNNLQQYLDMSTASLQHPPSLAACHGEPYGVLLDEDVFLRLILPHAH